jgi:polyisoprenoid-binding protein YceI
MALTLEFIMKNCPACIVLATAAAGLTAFAFLGGAGPAATTSAALATAVTASAPAGFAVDTVHSSVVFRVKHNGVANFYGRFNKVEGSFNLDEANPSASTVNITIDANSIDSANGKRDAHLKSADFFSAAEFPAITFVGKEFKKGSGSTYEVKGDLTMRGTTKSITVNIEDTGRASNPKGNLAGIGATFTINRGDFGVSYMLDKGLSNEVTIMIGLEGGQQASEKK